MSSATGPSIIGQGMMSVTRRSLIFVLLLVCCVHGLAVHAQPMDLRIDRDPAVEDYDFAWVYWFETRGQAYVREAVGARALPWDTPASRRWRGEVIEALVPMLGDTDASVRAAARFSSAMYSRLRHHDWYVPNASPWTVCTILMPPRLWKR